MAKLAPFLFSQWFDDNGTPLNGGKMYFYEADTLTPQDTYSDADGTSPNTNPVTLDSAGRANIFLDDAKYDVVLKDSLLNTIGTLDGIDGGFSESSLVANTDTLATLRAMDYGVVEYVLVGGSAGSFDGNARFFYWDATSTAVDNGSTIITPDGSPTQGRWLALVFSGDASGSFTVTATGMSTTVTGTAYYKMSGGVVVLTYPFLTGTSNATTFTLTGLPAAIRPASGLPNQMVATSAVTDDNVSYPGALCFQPNSGTVLIGKQQSFSGGYNFTAWTASGTKSLGDGVDFVKAFSVTYRV